VKKFIALAFLGLISSFFPVSTTDALLADDSTNLAGSAKASTSFVSPWETLAAVNDGFDPSSSGDYSHGAYGNWNGESDYHKYNWVQYEWAGPQALASTSVYWWNDGGGIATPVDAYVTCWNGASWSGAVRIGTALDRYNSVALNAMTTKIRIYMVSDLATGILEWKVFGTAGGTCPSPTVIPYVQINGGASEQTNLAGVVAGDSLLLYVSMPRDGALSWIGPSGFSAKTQAVAIKNIRTSQAGTYTACFVNSCGASSKRYFFVTVRSDADISAPYTWPAYSPNISYNFRDEYPDLKEPVMDLDDCPGVVGSQSSGWWTFRWGASANTLVTPAAVTPMLKRMNEEFAYFRDVMGWPPDKRVKRGYRSAIYLYGSGLCTDDASNTDLGGWQSSIYYNDEDWPMVLLSYYPVYSFDPACPYSDKEYQMSGVVHEGIHSVLADLPGCKEAAWFQEGGNTWLQQEASARRTGNYGSMGFLNGASFIAPFMPVECYSGWLQDGSFGGPSAEGVNRTNANGDQICTWRNLLGGVQYSNVFPTFLGLTLGPGSVPWIWRYCPSRVLEGMAAGLGDAQMRRLIMEYRAKQALVDMGPWTGAVKDLLNSQFGTIIQEEYSPFWIDVDPWSATPYVNTTNNNGLLTPEARTLPGWSGANQIPLHVTGGVATVNFRPYSPNMTCQLCYRSADGRAVYGTPVFGGDCSLRLDRAPANGVVFAVICNTDYIYEGDETRQAHSDYRLKIVEGVTGAADINQKWYDWTLNLSSK